MTTWARIQCDMLDKPSVIALAPDRQILFLASILWSARTESDGFVPPGALPVLAAKAKIGERARRRAAVELVDAGLWVDIGSDQGGWQISGYHDWQPSKAENEARRASDAERQRRRRERMSRRDSDVTPSPTTRHDTTRHVPRSTSERSPTLLQLSSVDDEIERRA